MQPLSELPGSASSVPSSLTLGLFCLALYALAFGAAALLVQMLAGPWRRSVGAHWTEQARLAYAPNYGLLWLGGVLPPATALVGIIGLGVLAPQQQAGMLGFWLPWLAALAGILTVRYRWVRELWRPRVTIRSWLAGCLVLLLVLVPHILIMLLLIMLFPETPNGRAMIVLGAGVLANTFFAFGGGVWLLRLIGVVRPAPPQVTQMVEQLAQQMQVPGRVKVFELEWAQLNAVAWPLYRAVGFSRPLLEIMAPDEVRAVAAHELAHLLEPNWARAVRIGHMFAYLAVAPVMRYTGASGILAGWLLMVLISLSSKRFGRRMEVRADRLESEAIADPNAYMRSLVKLHEANLAPAVMPGTQTHPHLYDRLLAGGIQPEFPRPPAPARTKPLLAVMSTGIATVVILCLLVIAAGVVQRLGARPPESGDPTAALPSRFKTQQEVPQPDFGEAAKDPHFQAAIQEAARLLGAQPQALESQAEQTVVNGGVSFEVPAGKLEAILLRAHTNFLAKGCYLFRYDHHFGIQGHPDKVGLLPTRDKYAVMAAMGTNGDNYEIGTAGIIAWMKELEQDQPFILTGIGFDFMEGQFTSPVKDPPGLAKRMYQFCPDIVDQGTESVEALAAELQKGKLYFWWD